MSSPMRAVFAVALVAALPLSCKKNGKIEIKDPTLVKGDGSPVQPSVLAPVTSAAELLPPTTQIMFEAKSAMRAFEVGERERWVAAFPKEYAKATAESVEEFGVNVLDPATWADIGIDLNGPAGFCILSAEFQAGCGFATVSDPGKFRQFLVDAAGRKGLELRPTSLGGAEILRTKNRELSFVIRPPVAMFVFVDREEDAPDYAQEIAVADPMQALAASSAYRRATGSYAGSDVVGFMNVASIAGDAIGQQERYAAEYSDAADKSYRKREASQTELLRFISSGFSAVGVRGDAKRNSVIVEAKVTMPEDAFPRAIIKTTDAQPPMTWAMDGRLLMMLSGTVDVDNAVKFLDMIAKADGGSWAEIVTDVKHALTVDLNEDVTPLLTGAGGGAVGLDKELTFKRMEDIPKSLGFGVYADVSDPKKARALLDKAVGRAKLLGVKVSKNAKTGAHSFVVPDYRTVHVGVHGKHLVASTDPNLGPRMEKGKAGSVAKKTTPSGAYAAMSRKGSAAAYATDYSPFLWLLMGRSFDAKAESRAAAGIPESRKVRAKKKEIAAVEKKLDAARNASEAANAKKAFGIVDAIGMTVFTVREDPDGLTVHGGHFLRTATMGDLVDRVARAVKEGDGPEDKKLQELRKKRDRLEAELRELIVADAAHIEKSRAKRK